MRICPKILLPAWAIAFLHDSTSRTARGELASSSSNFSLAKSFARMIPLATTKVTASPMANTAKAMLLFCRSDWGA